MRRFIKYISTLILGFLSLISCNSALYEENIQEKFNELQSKVELQVNKSNDLHWLYRLALSTKHSQSELLKKQTLNQFKDIQYVILVNKTPAIWTSEGLDPFNYSNLWKLDDWSLIGPQVFAKKFYVNYRQQELIVIAYIKINGQFVQSKKILPNLDFNAIYSNSDQLIAYQIKESSQRNTLIYVALFLAFYGALLYSIYYINKKKRKWALFMLYLFGLLVSVRSFDLICHVSDKIDVILFQSQGVAYKFFSTNAFSLLFLIISYLIVAQKLNAIVIKYGEQRQKFRGLTIGFGFFMLNYFGIFCIILVIKNLVKSTGIHFDFTNVLNIPWALQAVLVGITGLILCFFFNSYLSFKDLHQSKMKPKYIYVSSILALIPYLIGFEILKIELSITFVILILALYILLFDMFKEIQKPTLGWMVVWIIFFSTSVSTLLFKFSKDQEKTQKINVLQKISNQNDVALFERLNKQIKSLKSDQVQYQEIINLLNQSKYDDVSRVISSYLLRDDYIQRFYTLSALVEVYDSLNKKSDVGAEWKSYSSKLNPDKVQEFKYRLSQKGYHSFYVQIDGTFAKFKNIPKITLSFVKKSFENINFHTVSLDGYLDDSSKFLLDYAIYKNGYLVESQGRLYPEQIDNKIVAQKSQILELTSNMRSELIKSSHLGLIFVVGSNLGGLTKPISLFSLFFIYFSIIILFITIINTFFRFISPHINLYFSRKISLRQRIEFSILIVILISFAVIAWITTIYFKNLSTQMQKTQILNAGIALKSELEQLNKDSLQLRLDLNISPTLNHAYIKYTVFNMYGQNIFTNDFSQSAVKLNQLMNPCAFLALQNEEFYLNELSKSANPRNYIFRIQNQIGQSIGFISIKNEYPTQVSPTDFLGTLLNVYVFLFLIAGGFAIAVSNTVIKPLVNVVDNLKKLKLDKKNEKIEWKNNDEVGTLILEYNNMLQKLEESASMLAKSEREGAWREMAQQVAHEIKNPLTPMKLSVQYLEQKIKGEKDSPLNDSIKNTAATIIEQIDNLAAIANEFSTFAKMPAPILEMINLTSIVSSVHEIFRKNEHSTLNLKVPIDDVEVYGDKGQIIRVLNNIIQNAIQSIPPDRQGFIHIELNVLEKIALLKIKDNGAGIQEEMFGKVFYPNFTTKTSGMGLGLAMCKSIIESIGGKIYFESTLNIQTEFFVEIPLKNENLIE